MTIVPVTPARRAAIFCLLLLGSCAAFESYALDPVISDSQLAVIPEGILADGSTISGGWGWAGNSDIGFSFSVTAPVQVTALAYYVLPTPLSGGHVVRLWDESAPAIMLAMGSVGPGVLYNPSLNINFAYTAVPPVTLFPGHSYRVSGAGNPDRNTFFYSTTIFSPAANIMVSGVPSGAAMSFGGDFFFKSAVLPLNGTYSGSSVQEIIKKQ